MRMEWISVEDRLPDEITQFVLVARFGGTTSIMEANFNDGKFIVHRFGMMSEFINPTHWMPYEALPAPPTNT